jgi:aryl-alcohol dehydrogenase-like predicted oxidoreductase
MDYRTFGRSGLRVSELILGAMTFGEEHGGVPAAECRAIFTAYAEAGGNVVDTANRYTRGESERIVGDLVAADRDRFVVATKYTLALDDNDPNSAGNHRLSLRRSLEQSLRNLRTDRVDLLWVHIWDQLTPIEETMRALDDAVRAGKVLYIGVSNMPAWLIARANTMAELHGWSPFVGVQMPYSLVKRDIEREILPMSDAMGLSVAAWSPLGSGILSGSYSRPGREPSRADRDSISPRHLDIAQSVDLVADEMGASSAQVALAWTMARRGSVHPIVGASRVEQLRDNLAATQLTLRTDALRALDEVSAIEPGYPSDFITAVGGAAFGAAGSRVRAGRP